LLLLRIPARRLALLAGMLVASTPAVAAMTAGVVAPAAASVPTESPRPALEPLAESYRAAMLTCSATFKPRRSVL